MNPHAESPAEAEASYSVEELIPKLIGLARMLAAAPQEQLPVLVSLNAGNIEYLANMVREAHRREVFEARRDEIQRAGESFTEVLRA